MSREANPKIVGAFVLGALALIVVVFMVFSTFSCRMLLISVVTSPRLRKKLWTPVSTMSGVTH